MATRIILISGRVSAGKTTLSTGLANQFGITRFRTRTFLTERDRARGPRERLHLQRAGDRLDRRTRGKWVLDELDRRLRALPLEAVVLLDSVRTANQIDHIRDAYGTIVSHIHLTAPIEELQRRYADRVRRISGTSPTSYAEIRRNKTEQEVDKLKGVADVVIDTNRCTKEDVLVRAASLLSLYGDGGPGYVDVIVGGQYGSEGKGQIASYVSRDYDLLVRVGGPNAGHKVFENPPYTHHQLPSGARRNVDAKLLIGPGAVLNVNKLLDEVAECDVDADRLCIDENSMIISDQDIKDEADLKKSIGSTGQGVGAATARRIRQRALDTVLARDVPELTPYIGKALDVLDRTFSKGGRVLLEGTQGTGLSLYHGSYPYVTSRDTTVSGCLADAGISPSKVRRIVMVCRTYPIRVEDPPGSTSGPMSLEIRLEDIAGRSGIDLEELERTERTSTTDRMRRIGEFDWSLLRKAALLNGPTDIALTFTDYLSLQNAGAKRFDQLHTDTINFVQEIERVTRASVSLIATGFNSRSIIDRRTW